MIETVEQPHATSDQKWHDVQLQLIDKSSRQGLPCDVGAASDGCVAITCCLLRGIDRSRKTIGDEDELGCSARPWSRRAMGDHEVRHCVRCVIPTARILAGPVRACARAR